MSQTYLTSLSFSNYDLDDAAGVDVNPSVISPHEHTTHVITHQQKERVSVEITCKPLATLSLYTKNLAISFGIGSPKSPDTIHT
mmetsp:Transcript_4947/g.7533  ORF Transcript_4947/g.7533 Transcript_4947/m.7533 type:complete len:84 (-) Transcript_4947:33-284(-)